MTRLPTAAALESPQRVWPRMRWLAAMLRRLEPGARVLDVGCGNGVPATREIARRHEAVGIDVSAAQIERARRNVPDAELIQGDLGRHPMAEAHPRRVNPRI